jgi:hypothetical protein
LGCFNPDVSLEPGSGNMESGGGNIHESCTYVVSVPAGKGHLGMPNRAPLCRTWGVQQILTSHKPMQDSVDGDLDTSYHIHDQTIRVPDHQSFGMMTPKTYIPVLESPQCYLVERWGSYEKSTMPMGSTVTYRSDSTVGCPSILE